MESLLGSYGIPFIVQENGRAKTQNCSFSGQLTWLNTTILVLLDLGVDLVKSGVSRVLTTRNTRRDIVILMKVVSQRVSWVRIALRDKEEREKRDKR